MCCENKIIKTHNQIHYVWLYKKWMKVIKSLIDYFTLIYYLASIIFGRLNSYCYEGPIYT